MSTTIPAAGIRARFPLNRKNVGWGIMLVLATIILLVDLPLLSPTHPYRWYHFKVRYALIPHWIFGSVALLSGPFQFSSRIRRQYPRIHRILGRYYVASVLIAAPLGIWITLLGPKDLFYSIGIDTHAAVWFICTLMAFITARNRQIPEHRQWMVRSYVLTFSFIATRVIGPFWMLIGFVHGPHEYGLVDTGLNVVYLLVADIGLNWKQITTRRPGLANPRAAHVADQSG